MAVEIIRPANREEWLEIRKTGIGSSAIGTIAGVNPYESRFELYQRLRGLIPAKEENEDMKQGHELEAAVASMFERSTGLEIIQRSSIDWMFRNSDKPWELASPDRTYWLSSAKKNGKDWQSKGILECKTTKRKDVSEDNIPDYWFAQVQWQLGIGGMQEAHIAWLNKWGCEFGYKKIEFNKTLFEMLEDIAEDFWFNNIKGGVEPVEMNASDVKRVFPVEQTGKVKMADAELIELIDKYKRLKKESSSVDGQIETIKSKLVVAMCDCESLKTEDGVVLATFKANKSTDIVDLKTLENENPELVKKYTHTVMGNRILRIK